MKMFGTCIVEGCGAEGRRKRGMCLKHYGRWERHGDPLAGGTEWGVPLAFLRAVLEAGSTDDCIDWPYGKVDGYGVVRFEGAVRKANNLICEWRHGPPPGPQLLSAHSCGRPCCVNPQHLRWATPAENSADAVMHGTTKRVNRDGAAKLLPSEVIRIRQLHGVVPAKSIAKEFGVSHKTVNSIWYRESWKWLEVQP